MNVTSKEKFQKAGVKQCVRCGRDMHEIYPKDICPVCEEIELFHHVKEFIRENVDVREQDVADKFNIPIGKVRGWIREGRIQYKEDKSEKIVDLKCKICGKPIAFGVTCAECHSLQQLQVVAGMNKMEDGRMHFLGKEKE